MKIHILLIILSCFTISGIKAGEARSVSADSAYAVVNVSVCSMRGEGRFTSGMTTQALLGMPVKVLQYTGGNKTEAARLMHIGLTTLYRKIEEYGIR